ncbi:arginyl-tRNA synthetase [Persephonella hydrogeniphila]|uniref:Arginine--tRNA ligase n=1 Tax=Persephonella hydrogeniphila TaxID=198703 RepID=A0A285NL31_9AQUI|nr:arginine--tRNA ligase [Persephonella hydrogeniphila]SNZ10165.1 arginyl-tRNA synthetase [Persephonella hydrogeniphila]
MKEEIKNRIIEELKKHIPEVEQVKDKLKIDIPKEDRFGDLSINIAFLLSKYLKKKPVDIASEIKEIIQNLPYFSKVEVAGAGFINIFLSTEYYSDVLRQILEEKDRYGVAKEKNRGRINIEFVSANPTGPLHLGHGRGAVVGNVQSNLYEYIGYEVEREFYINDAGNQIKKLGESVYARFRQIEEPDYPFPEDGYHGEYIKEIAEHLYRYEREKILSFVDEKQAIDFCAEFAKELLLERIKNDLKEFGVEFDIWFSEKKLYTTGKVDEAIQFLKDKGMIYEKEGAVWVKTSLYGDDKDRVIIKSDGSYTYFAGDIAYHYDKFKRGYDFIVNVWGADHHGYFPRLKAAVMAFGVPENWIKVIFIQLVKLFRNGQEVKMSKRSGSFITLKELIEEVGKDAVIYFFLTKDSDTHLNFDIDLALKKSSENPVYYVQYAHARICSVFREAKEKYGFDPEEDFEGEIDLLKEEQERILMKHLAFIPDLIREAGEKQQPHKLTQITYQLASDFHYYYNNFKFLVKDDEKLMRARLFLLKAIREALRTLFRLMGITPVERM